MDLASWNGGPPWQFFPKTSTVSPQTITNTLRGHRSCVVFANCDLCSVILCDSTTVYFQCLVFRIFTPLRVGGPPTPQAFLANSNTYTKNHSKEMFFFSVFTMCSVENTVIYAVFGLKSVQNTGFCSVFNALASNNHSRYRYLQCFFISVRFSLAGSRPKWPKIPFQWPLKLRHPKIVEKTRKHHPTEVSVRNRFWAPPPAKADIATAILTNVIKHLV